MHDEKSLPADVPDTDQMPCVFTIYKEIGLDKVDITIAGAYVGTLAIKDLVTVATALVDLDIGMSPQKSLGDCLKKRW